MKHAYETATGEGMQASLFNLRRPLLQDVRVREALVLAWDYDKYNRFGTFRPTQSVFPNSEFAAAGTPSPGELALLEPLRAEIPPRVFGPAFEMPRTNTGPNALRNNLRLALADRELAERLLQAAKIDGALRAEAIPPAAFLRLAALWDRRALL